MTIQEQIGTTEQEIHLRDYLHIIRKRRNTVVVFFVITIALVLIGTLASTPIFEASTQVLIEKSDQNPLLPQSAYGSYDPEFSETQVQIIKSFNVASRVVRNLELDSRNREKFYRAEDGIFSLTHLLKLFRGLLPDSLLKKDTNAVNHSDDATEADLVAEEIREAVTVKPVRNSRIVSITYEHPDPVMARLVVNAVAKAYMDEALEIKMNSASYTIQWMSEKTSEEKERLENAEQELQRYMRESNIVTLENKITVLPEKLSEFSTKLSQSVAEKNALEALIRKIDEIGANQPEAETIIKLSENPHLQTILDQQLKAEQQKLELAKKYGPKHPKMINANEEISSLKKEKSREVKRVFDSIRNRYDIARNQVGNLEKILKETRQEAQDLNQKFIRYDVLKREVETNKTLYESLLTQMKEHKVTEQTNRVNIWVIAEAKTPEYPAKPRKKINLALGLLLGLFGGIGLAFFIEYLDNTVSAPDEAETRLGVSVLGIIDQLGKDEDPDQALAKDEFSTFSEGFKSIRTAILLSAADKPPKKLLVTSMLPKEGKTTITINLARTFAKAGYRVLVIDSDLRKPRVHKVFGSDNSRGLSVYLAGIEDGEIVQTTDEDGISVITAGPIPPNPSELLISNRFKNLLSDLGEKYDFIFIDSAPLFSATETLLLSQVADGTLLSARAGSTSYDLLREGFKSLKEVRSTVLGLVINALDRKRAGYGYGYGNYYGGRYYKYAAYYTKDPKER